MSITLIGDIHGKQLQYIKLTEENPYTIALGDIGFNYDHMSLIDPVNHKILGGNHDNYDKIHLLPHYLGDFGFTELNGVKFFFVRGALSIDKHLRTEGKNWWRREQLTIAEGEAAIDLYIQEKPEIVLTHDCPFSIVPLVLTNDYKKIPSLTNQLLQTMYELHQPKQWFFGHHHNNRFVETGHTIFRCVDELCTINIPF